MDEGLRDGFLLLCFIVIFFGVIGIFVGGYTYKRKNKPLINGLFLGGFIGVLGSICLLGILLSLLLIS